jgi:hypothetical protein
LRRCRMYELDGDDGLRMQDEGDDRGFARRGSALRASSRRNPRILPCPSCGQPNKLTPADKRQGYQCDDCANRDEGNGY